MSDNDRYVYFPSVDGPMRATREVFFCESDFNYHVANATVWLDGVQEVTFVSYTAGGGEVMIVMESSLPYAVVPQKVWEIGRELLFDIHTRAWNGF